MGVDWLYPTEFSVAAIARCGVRFGICSSCRRSDLMAEGYRLVSFRAAAGTPQAGVKIDDRVYSVEKLLPLGVCSFDPPGKQPKLPTSSPGFVAFVARILKHQGLGPGVSAPRPSTTMWSTGALVPGKVRTMADEFFPESLVGGGDHE
jgi:hypothetical protein